jgi:hypothetical protein
MYREIVAASVAALYACGDVQNAPRTDPSTTLDEAIFKCSVEKILAKQCSYSACHGISNPGTAALRVYTPGKLRATTPNTLDDSIVALTDAEHHANFLSAAGFASTAATVDDNFLLRKPLPQDYGGFEHRGGAIFPNPADAQYATIRAWLAGSGACTP